MINLTTIIRVLLLTIISNNALAFQNRTVTLAGTINNFQNKIIEVLEYSDFITPRLQSLLEIPTDEGGHFEFDINLEYSKKIVLRLDEVFSSLHISPGHNYKLGFNKELLVSDIQSTDNINSLVKAIADDISKYHKKHVNNLTGSYKPSFSSAIHEFNDLMNAKYGSNNDTYFQQVFKYKLGGLTFLALGIAADTVAINGLEERLLTNTEVLFNNADYFKFLTYFYFWHWNLIQIRHFKWASDKTTLGNILREFSAIRNDTVRQYATLSYCKKTFGFEDGPKKQVINSILDSLQNYGVNSRVKAVARNLKIKYNGLKVGDQVKDFELTDYDGKLVKLSDFQGKYVLLDFWFRGCGSCIKAMSTKRRLKNDLSKSLEIISINPVDQPFRVEKYLSATNHNWVFLNAKGHRELLDYFTIDGYPKYMLVNPYGEVVLIPRDFDLKSSVNKINEMILGGNKD